MYDEIETQIDSREKIQEYLDVIAHKTGRSLNVEFKGLLCTITDNGYIIYTSAGGFVGQRYKTVETFLGGIVYGLNIRS